MKKVILIFTAFLIIFVGCRKIEELTQFYMEYDETIVIPSSTGINLPTNLFTPDIINTAVIYR